MIPHLIERAEVIDYWFSKLKAPFPLAQKKSTSGKTGAFKTIKNVYYFFFPFAGAPFAAFAAS
jgi:hypothetical protein